MDIENVKTTMEEAYDMLDAEAKTYEDLDEDGRNKAAANVERLWKVIKEGNQAIDEAANREELNALESRKLDIEETRIREEKRSGMWGHVIEVAKIVTEVGLFAAAALYSRHRFHESMYFEENASMSSSCGKQAEKDIQKFTKRLDKFK